MKAAVAALMFWLTIFIFWVAVSYVQHYTIDAMEQASADMGVTASTQPHYNDINTNIQRVFFIAFIGGAVLFIVALALDIKGPRYPVEGEWREKQIY